MNLSHFRLRCVLLLAALSLAACRQQKAAENEVMPDAKPGITVSGGVLTLPVVKGRPGAAYFELANGGDKTATLAAISIDGASKSELHETKGGTMAPLAAIDLKPGKTVKFERGGKHVMAFDIAETLKPGSTAEMTLTFAGGDKVSSPLKVETMAGAMDGMDHGDHN